MLGEFEDNIKQMGDTAEMPNTEILIDTTIVEFISLKAPEIYEKASVAPVDAYYYRDGASKKSQIKIADHVAGKSLDAEKLNDIVRRINYGENIPYAELPYVYTNPAVTSVC